MGDIFIICIVAAVTGAKRGTSDLLPVPNPRSSSRCGFKPQDEVEERQNITGLQEKGTQISGPQGRKVQRTGGGFRQLQKKERKTSLNKQL